MCGHDTLLTKEVSVVILLWASMHIHCSVILPPLHRGTSRRKVCCDVVTFGAFGFVPSVAVASIITACKRIAFLVFILTSARHHIPRARLLADVSRYRLRLQLLFALGIWFVQYKNSERYG